MKLIAEFSLMDQNAIINNSDIAKMAIQVAHNKANVTLSTRMTELAYAFYNSQEIYLKSYAKLSSGLTKLSDLDESQIQGMLPDLERAAYCFMITAKNAIDIWICILDVLETDVIRPENRLPDLSKGYVSNSASVTVAIDELKDLNWLKELQLNRNKIMHRGYTLKIDHHLSIPQVYDVFLTQEEVKIAEWESAQNTSFVLGIELLGKEKMNIEEIMTGLTSDFSRIDKHMANVFESENLFRLTAAQMQSWLISPPRLISNY